MFINLKTGAPAYLVSHDQDGSVTYSLEAPGVRGRHHTGVEGSHFFATHREATRDELDGITPATRPKPASKPAAAKPRQVAKPKPAARKAHKAPAKPRKAPPAAAKPPAGDKSPAGSAGPAGGEPGASAALAAGRQARAAQIAVKPGAPVGGEPHGE